MTDTNKKNTIGIDLGDKVHDARHDLFLAHG
jgi:hypothetical protein